MSFKYKGDFIPTRAWSKKPKGGFPKNVICRKLLHCKEIFPLEIKNIYFGSGEGSLSEKYQRSCVYVVNSVWHPTQKNGWKLVN